MYGQYYIVIATISIFFTLLLYTRLLGKKQMGHLTYFNYITGITLGSLCANTLGAFIQNLRDGIIAITIWAILTGILGLLVLKSLFFKLLFDGKSTVVIKHGQIQYRALTSLRLNLNDLMMLLREQGVFTIQEVDYAIFEPNGKMSILKKVNKQSVTKEEMKIITPIPKYMPATIITDGGIVLHNLKQLGLRKEWVIKQIKNVGIKSIKDIKYAEIQRDGSLFIDKMKKEV